MLYIGIVGNVLLLAYVVIDDPGSLWWCAGLLVLGGMLFAAEQLFGRRDRPARSDRADTDPATSDTTTGV